MASQSPVVPVHASLTVRDVQDLGAALVALADRYPLVFRTEKDFFPLVEVYLRGRVPGAATEHRVLGGAIDFRLGGTNPAVLELAVAPRTLSDKHHPGQPFPGHSSATQLYGSQNRPELKKLAAVPQTQAKRRFLLLVDLAKPIPVGDLQKGYEKELPKNKGHNPVHVIYVSRDPAACGHFTLGGKKKGPKGPLTP